MLSVSINTTHECRAHVLFTSDPIVERVSKMFKVPVLLCVLPAVLGIVVIDPLPSPSDYKYSYNIDDPTTGDRKSQHEVRLGDIVTGAYSVLGPDGTKRTVEYTADAKHGFKAIVREDPGSGPILSSPQTAPSPNSYYKQSPAKPSYTAVNANPNLDVQQAVYFTPDNNLKSSLSFNGQYFIPANRKY